MNKRHSLDIRKMVLEMYRDGYPVEKILQKSKVSRIRMYALVREAGLPHRNQKRPEQHTSANEADISSISLKEKKKIIDQFQISKNKSAFATEHHIPRSTLYNWSNNDNLIQDQNGNTVDMKMYSEALRSNEKLKKIIEVLHNVPCTRFSPLPVRMAAMEALADQYSANVLCEALCVNRSTFHHHMEDNKRENTWFNFRRNKLKKAIVEIYNEHNQIPGVKKIRALLQEQGNDVSEKMVRELMVELGISSIRNDAKEIYLSKAKEYDEINTKKSMILERAQRQADHLHVSRRLSQSDLGQRFHLFQFAEKSFLCMHYYGSMFQKSYRPQSRSKIYNSNAKLLL